MQKKWKSPLKGVRQPDAPEAHGWYQYPGQRCRHRGCGRMAADGIGAS